MKYNCFSLELEFSYKNFNEKFYTHNRPLEEAITFIEKAKETFLTKYPSCKDYSFAADVYCFIRNELKDHVNYCPAIQIMTSEDGKNHEEHTSEENLIKSLQAIGNMEVPYEI